MASLVWLSGLVALIPGHRYRQFDIAPDAIYGMNADICNASYVRIGIADTIPLVWVVKYVEYQSNETAETVWLIPNQRDETSGMVWLIPYVSHGTYRSIHASGVGGKRGNPGFPGFPGQGGGEELTRPAAAVGKGGLGRFRLIITVEIG